MLKYFLPLITEVIPQINTYEMNIDFKAVEMLYEDKW